MPGTPSLDATFLSEKFEAALDWDAYLATDTDRATRWREVLDRTALTAAQQALLAGFSREMHVLVLSGIWCGDCIQQGPMLERIARGSPRIRLRYLDRDEHADLSNLVRLNGGQRVPTVLLLAEDFELAGLYGDRTLSRYRALGARTLGPACPMPTPLPPDEAATTLEEWLDEFERCQWMLRLSARLRHRHGD
ncbi:MAG: thiol reductase thioredoxin [Phycisphaerae bacterium]|nr:thiol reductase thioredoxin [Phycisphaerae bacterium]